ncbi:hypothetical protein [Salinilacihabitans rarus]|uniref:hypothetical protein n=1 Tax=Salinilacihabitans rarus TaxID=2961596 RepID=UPI0020C8A23B|nr:hypothetical protein [Salinilacihabitans rarus]
MSEVYLVSTVLMGLLLVAIAVAVARSGQRANPSGYAGGQREYADWSDEVGDDSVRVTRLATEPAAWVVGFLALAIAVLVGAVLLLESPDLGLQTGLLGLGAAILLGYAVVGTFYAARNRTGGSAAAAAVAAGALGLLLLIAVTVVLVTA